MLAHSLFDDYLIYLDENFNGLVRLTRQANNSSGEGGNSNSRLKKLHNIIHFCMVCLYRSGENWLGENWYWLLVVMIAVFVLVLLACICCCYKQGHLRNDTGQIQLSR